MTKAVASSQVKHAAARKAAQLQQKQQQLALQAQQRVPLQPGGLVSPLDGTSPAGILPGGLGAYPLEAGARGPGSLAGLDAGRPQVNATNQSALAPNGDINQTVTNQNTYENKYYNIITSPYGVGGGYANPNFPSYGGWGSGFPYGQQTVIDPTTGALMVRNESGFIGWVKRLFRGY